MKRLEPNPGIVGGPERRTARLAGLLYLIVVLTGPFVLLYVPQQIFVPGDASATVARILQHESLFRAGIGVGLVSEIAFLLAVLVLFRLLRDVGPTLAALMVIAIFLDAPLAILSAANQAATLAVVRGADFLSVFDKPQRDALATLLIQFDRKGVLVSELFWGLWLLPLGVLVYRSTFLPRWLGVWLFLNGLAYVAICAAGLVVPAAQETVRTVVTPVLFGEAAFTLWLVVVGVRVRAGGAPGSDAVRGRPA